MSEPKRIQRKRTRGWRMPEGAVYVGRPTIYGNPFRVIKSTCCKTVDVMDDNGVTYIIDHKWAHEKGWEDVNRPGAWKWARSESVRLFYDDLVVFGCSRVSSDEIRDELAGKDLACWCPLDQPCHADVLLEIANS